MASVDKIWEPAQDEVLHETEVASLAQPSVLVEGHLVHVCEMRGEWEVWINCEDANFTGVCIGVAPTREEAVAEALKVVDALADHLRRVDR
jgi:hypothetical protein